MFYNGIHEKSLECFFIVCFFFFWMKKNKRNLIFSVFKKTVSKQMGKVRGSARSKRRIQPLCSSPPPIFYALLPAPFLHASWKFYCFHFCSPQLRRFLYFLYKTTFFEFKFCTMYFDLTRLRQVGKKAKRQKKWRKLKKKHQKCTFAVVKLWLVYANE